MYPYERNGFYGRVPDWHGYMGYERAKEQPLTFVLVHGSFADVRFWNGVAGMLRKMGHKVFVPEYPGHGSDPNTNVTHGMISRAVADFILARQLRDIRSGTVSADRSFRKRRSSSPIASSGSSL